MTPRDLLTDLAAVRHPLPTRPDLYDEDHDETHDEIIWSDIVDRIERERAEAIENWRTVWDADPDIDEEGRRYDPLLDEIRAARGEVAAAEQRIRLLLAYAREFVSPRPYTLADLAHAASMSPSGIRTAYSDDDVREVEDRTGGRARLHRVERETP